MSDDEEADLSLLLLLRQSLGISDDPSTSPPTPQTGVLRSAEYIYNNSIDVAIDSSSTKRAATTIYSLMQSKQHSTQSWSAHSLHPQAKDEATLKFIFTMDLLNFSFWSERSEGERFAVKYRGKRWTGYWALVACLQRAVDEGSSAGTILWPAGPGDLLIRLDEQEHPSRILIFGRTRMNAPPSCYSMFSAHSPPSRYPCCRRG
jgi:Potential Queuosine, Q, salvage protein family